MLDADGRFEVVGLPGRGLIAVRDEGDRYLPASGLEKIPGYDAKNQLFRTVPNVLGTWHAVIAEVDAAPGSEEVTLGLTADPGRSLAVEVVGPDGTPWAGRRSRASRNCSRPKPCPRSRPDSRSAPSPRASRDGWSSRTRAAS